jgi:hypothetical protein
MFVIADICHMTSSSIAFLATNTLYPILRQLNKVEKKNFFKVTLNIGLPNTTRLWRALFKFSVLLQFFNNFAFIPASDMVSEFQLSSFGHL